MFSFLVIAAFYWIGCAFWFQIVQKPAFGIHCRKLAVKPITLKTVADIYRNGFNTDAILASYLTAIPLLIATLRQLFPAFEILPILTVYNILVAPVIGLGSSADIVLYPFWQYKLEGSVLGYLKTPKEAAASVSNRFLIGAVIFWLVVSASLFLIMQASIVLALKIMPMPSAYPTWFEGLLTAVILLIGLGLLFLIVRGLGSRPNRPSIAFFSTDPFLNNWSLNPIYSFIYSLQTLNEYAGRFRFMADEESEAIVDRLFPRSGQPVRSLLKTDRPNVLLVIWESFGADFSAKFGGRPVATKVDRLANESICFTECTAGSMRTDRGLVNILSGYPAQPTASVIRNSRIIPTLPALPRRFRDEGYTTMAIHGGNMSFMNINAYYVAMGHDILIEQKDFAADCEKCKWGVHDGPVMQRTADEILKLNAEGKTPFFVTLQTLSSHEPFDVPFDKLDRPEDNAMAYSDAAFGEMIDRLKQSDVWRDLLVVVVADHSLNLPRPVENRRNFSHIPLMLLGGAVREPARIDTIMSQTDLAATLLGQLGLPHDEFRYSRDVLADTYTDPFALNVFINGAMVADNKGTTVYDTLQEKIVEGTDENERLHKMKAILQTIYTDLNNR